jgi:hypothetical protein
LIFLSTIGGPGKDPEYTGVHRVKRFSAVLHSVFTSEAAKAIR